ncbi:MAG: L,D-transpeptidase family protein [Patescibacteria group bacterium]
MSRSINSKLGYLKLDYAKFIIMLLFFVFSAQPLLASDSDNIDTDGDGYSDQLELKNNYSPFNSRPLKLEKSDADSDGLSDYWELKFKTNPLDPDSDGDGFKDKEELDSLYNPLSSSTKKLVPRIEIDTKKQQLTYFIAGQAWKKMVVSTGKPSMPTPRGNFTVINKSSKAWSKTYKLWMPYWLGLNRGEFGIHELPIWPGGYREGANHLGQAVSHGCIRLGVGDAKYLFDRVATGTTVIIK